MHKPKISFSKLVTIKSILRKYSLNSVCEESFCPNISQCFGERGTVTFMILGNVCTRACGYCSVPRSRSTSTSTSISNPDPEEPYRLAEAVKEMGLKYVILTSPDRDDLDDGGASHFAKCVNVLRKQISDVKIEVLTPDFGGKLSAFDVVFDSNPDVFAHNIETVPRLYKRVRPKADYSCSLSILKLIKSNNFVTKTSLIVGLGETDDEVLSTIQQISFCDIITIGQYLSPSHKNIQISRVVSDAQFGEYENFGKRLGTLVFAGKFVRSSFLADNIFEKFLGR